MDDPVLVGYLQTRRHLAQDADLLHQSQRSTLLADLLQVHALQVLHHDVRDSLVFPHIVDRHDALVTQLSRRGRLAPEPGQHLRIVRGRDHLDGHLALHQRIVGTVDASKAAAADFLQNFIPPDAFHVYRLPGSQAHPQRKVS